MSKQNSTQKLSWITILLISAILLIFSVRAPPVAAASGMYTEDFTTTTYLDVANTNATGWGSGTLNLPTKSAYRAGYVDTGFAALGIFIEGNYAYIADAFAGLTVIDITDPANPSTAGNYDTTGYPYDVDVSGDYAYVADYESGMTVLNITDPTNPTLAGSYNTPDNALGIYIAGDIAYVADGNTGLILLNITDPTSPTFISSFDTPYHAYDVVVRNDFAYVADGSNGVRVVNVTDVNNPTAAGFYDTPRLAWGLCVSGDYLFVADEQTGLQILNITYPSTPTYCSVYDTPGWAQGVDVIGDFAYVADLDFGLQIINIADIRHPTLTGTVDTPDHAYDVRVVGEYAYVADRASGLQVIKIADVVTPRLVGSYNSPGEASGIYIEGNYAYLTDGSGTTGGLRIVNITDPTAPTPVSQYRDGSFAKDVVVEGDFAFVSYGYAGLRIINVSDPTQPTLAGHYPAPDYVYEVFVAGNYAYLACYWAGLLVVNITDITNPVLVGSYDTPGDAEGIWVSGNFAYVADRSEGLHIFNITNPSDPTFVTTYNATYVNCHKVVISGDYAFVANAAGILVLDISDPTMPTYVDDWSAIWNLDVFIEGDHAYLACSDSGLYIVDITDPTNIPWPAVGRYDTPDYCESVFVEGEYAYVPDWDTGLLVIEVMANRYRQYQSLAVAQSSTVFSDSSITIDKATLTITHTVPSSTSIAYYLSADNGTHWELVTLGVPHIFSYPGYELKWQAILTTSDTVLTPTISALSITYHTQLFSPNLVTPTDGFSTNDDTPIFEWGSVTGASSYLIQLDTVNTFDSPDLINGSDIGLTTFTPSSPLAEGTWYWRVAANDSQGDIGLFSITRSINIDITAPIWIQTPSNQIFEYGSSLSYNVNASDLAGIDYYWVNDTSRFYIDGNGIITNSTDLSVGIYWLEVRAYDPANNYCNEVFSITIEDTTSPTWDQIPSNQNIDEGIGFSYDLDASDLVGIDHWWINDTENFNIDNNGVITNATVLSAGVYYLEVRAYDASNNYCSATFTVTVKEAPIQTPPPFPWLIVLGGIVVIVIVVVVFVILWRRKPLSGG